MKKILTVIFLFTLLASCKEQSNSKAKSSLNASSHPSLILTQQGVKDIRANLGSVPLFDATLAAIKEKIDTEIEAGFDVPVPKDYSGGYTHEKHKTNYILMQQAGVLYQILDEVKYALFVKDMLFEYAKMYPTLPIHPKPRSYARGKLFWQCLNDSNWLVYTSQAYDCIYNYLSEEERNTLETDLFKPFADYISKDNPKFFNRVHNHSTWGNAAVGMIALAMDDDSLLQRAMYGYQDAKIDPNLKDNDGGYINRDGKMGFLANLDEPFSPDGYFTEGPYYQRYASYPFLIFAQALQNKKPELNVLYHKDSVLLKSVNALINLSDADGEFFVLNDAQKGMSLQSKSLVSAVDIAYHFGGNNPELLSIAESQNEVTLDDAGLAVALGVKNGKAKPFSKNSIELSDGADGDQGAVGILRNNDLELVFKYTAHGLSHGHFDKLSFSLFENGDEIIQDYGMSRYVNVEQKGGGNYLKENKTWSKQTIAHNTIVQNEGSQFKGKYDIGSKHHAEKYIFDDTNKSVQVASAKEPNAYQGTEMHRTMVMIQDEDYNKPYLLDIMRVKSNQANQYDLPLYYLGQIVQANFEYNKHENPTVLGTKHGYQHLFEEAKGSPNTDNIKLTWLLNNTFYSYSATASSEDEIILARIGANDPDYNLRAEPSIIIRRKDTQNTVFASVIESHGTYSPISEYALNAYSNIKSINVVVDTDAYTAVQFETTKGKTKLFVIANQDANKETEHKLTINNKELSWKGSYILTENK